MLKNSKILITGATGLIGQELVRQCVESQIGVHYLTTRKDQIENREGVSGFYWNPSKGEIDLAAFNGVTAIINLAGASVSKRWTAAYKKTILDSRVQTANVLAESLKKITHQITHYVSSSGISLYPNSLTKLYDEQSSEVSDSFLSKVVVEWERGADQFSALGIKVSKVRTGIVLDGEGGALVKMVQPIKMGVGSPLGSGKQWQSWIHIQDIAGIFLHLIHQELEGVYNGVAPSPVTNKKMTQVIAKYLGKPLWLPAVPAFALRLLLGEMGSLALESQLVSAKKVEESGYRYHYVNLEQAISNLL